MESRFEQWQRESEEHTTTINTNKLIQIQQHLSTVDAERDRLVADVRRLVEAARMVIKISDRNHDAWDDTKTAIASVERYLEDGGGLANG